MGIVQKPEGPGAGGISDQPGRQAISQIAPVQCTHETCLGALRENLQALGGRFITVHVWDSWIIFTKHCSALLSLVSEVTDAAQLRASPPAPRAIQPA